MPVAAQTAGLVLLVAMPLLLARAWRRGADGRVARLGGWTALAGALVAFGMGFGAARGIALAFATLPIIALPVIALRRDRRPPGRTRIERANATPSRANPWRMAARAVVALPLAGTASVLSATGTAHLWETMSIGIIASLALAILFWSASMLWAVSDPRLLRPAAGLALIALSSGLWLAWG